MSSSDSDSDGDRITDWPFRCTCQCGAPDCSHDSDTDYEDTESQESFSDESSSEESTDNKKTIFISIFNHKTIKNKNLISDAVEIQNYREKYKKLPLKNTNNIKKIWADVKIDMPTLGQVPLKRIDIELTNGKKDKDSNKKKFKKPTHLIQKNLSADFRADKSEQSDVANKSNKIVHPIVKQVYGKLPQAQINKETNKETKIKKANELISKVAVKNINSNENKNQKNEPNISDKLTQSVKPPITKDNLKSNTDKTVNSNTNTLISVQPITENKSAKNISNTSNPKSTNENNSVKANLIKTPVKAVAENKIKKNEENKKKTTVASRLLKEEFKKEIKSAKIKPYKKSVLDVESENSNSSISNMKSSAEDKTVKVDDLVKSDVKIDTENKIEKTNLVEPSVISNTENEIQKDESIDSNVEFDEDQTFNNMSENEIKLNVKSNAEDEIEKDVSIDSNVEFDEEDQTLNKNLNKKLKLEVIKFKIPNSDKIIPSSNKNKNKTSANDKNLQSNKKLSKKQKKKIRQKEKNLGADARKISTSSSRDLSVSSSKSFDDKKSKNNSNKNVKEEAAKPKKEKVNTADKNKTENTKLVKSGHSKQDTEESEIEEMNSSNDNLDLLTDTEHMPTFIADIIKRKEKNKQAKMKPVTETQTKNNNKKASEQEKIKIENEQEFTVHMKKRKHVPFSDNKDYIIYSDRYAEEGVEMILENNLMGALECITVAIEYNQSDYRHYLNRCYCYLKMKKPVYALADAQYVIQLCTNIGQLFIANLRAGQAAYALQDYKQAEYFLKEATRINPENHHAQREFLRVKISHIMSLGFNEKDALIALQKYPSVLEAIGYLNKSQKNSSISKFNNNFDIHDYYCDDMVFSSGDEEESENFETMNRMLNYQPGKVKIQHLVAKPVKSEFLLGSSNCDINGKPKINPDSKKKLVPTHKSANDKAIWVGNLTNNITEQMLKKKFKQFGNVISVYRPCNEAYAFINFEKREDVTNALINTSAHEIAGVKLAVRSAVRQK